MDGEMERLGKGKMRIRDGEAELQARMERKLEDEQEANFHKAA